MKLSSWNVNGIRAGIKKGTFFEYLIDSSPDVIGLQEVKANLDQLTKGDISEIESLGYSVYWNSAKRPGYSGTAILSKIEPISILKGIDIDKIDTNDLEIDDVISEDIEGRVLTLEFSDFYFMTVYTPNSKRELERLEYRKSWDRAFIRYIKYLEQTKNVIVCGDLNVAHKEIDLARPRDNMTTDKKSGSAGFTDIERRGMTMFLDEYDMIDTFRYFYPDRGDIYSWWSNFGKARDRNIGWRIDYFLASQYLRDYLKDASIRSEVMGSDHCPVELYLK